jgi:hypothetical protein
VSAWSVLVEVIVLGQGDDGGLLWERRSAPLPNNGRPDELALQLAGVEDRPGSVSHSTSWRYADPVTLVLTYAALPGGRGRGEPLVEPAVVTSGLPLRPQPEHLHSHHVVAHAVLHLVELSRRDLGLDASRRTHPALWAAMEAGACSTPTAPHPEAHRLAAGQQP